MIALLAATLGIALLDVVLSGDNALVIGAAAAGLAPKQQRRALIVGVTLAALLRIVCTALASFLLLLPWLQAIGGLLLLGIAIRLLLGRAAQQADRSERQQRVSRGLVSALLTIVVADATMSLDNILAVGALAHGNLLALGLGISASMALLLVGSALVAKLVSRLRWMIDLAALVLAWIGANMALDGLRITGMAWTIWVYALFLTVIVAADIWLRIREARTSRPKLS